MDAVVLLQRAHAADLTVWAEDDSIQVEGYPTPAALVVIETLRQNKPEILAYLRQEPAQDSLVPWMLQEWRRVSIPDWRRILRESVTKGDKGRADYALWMLTEVLFDPEYEEDQ